MTFADIALLLIRTVSLFILFMALLQAIYYTALVVLAWKALRKGVGRERFKTPDWLLSSHASTGISVLVPAYNEAANIVENIHSMLSLHYPLFEVVVVNDGSKDDTAQRVIEAFKLERSEMAHPDSVLHKPVRGVYRSREIPNLVFIDKENGGKSDALNAGINYSRHPLFCSIDADSLLDPDSLLKAVRPFVEDPGHTIAVGGTIRVVNDSEVHAGRIIEERFPKKWLARFQYVEYFRAFMLARLAFSHIRSVAIISGAFGVFKRRAVIAVGGYTHGTVGEDFELVVKLHKFFCDHDTPYRIYSIPEPVCWTEVPESLKILRRQRSRWQRGMCETLFTHRSMILKRKYKTLGVGVMPLFVVFDILGPIVELVAYLMLAGLALAGILSWAYFWAFFCLVVGYGMFLSVLALVMSEATLFRSPRYRDMPLLWLTALLENLGYRQLNGLWRMEGLWQFFRKKQAWGDMQRKGFAAKKQ